MGYISEHLCGVEARAALWEGLSSGGVEELFADFVKAEDVKSEKAHTNEVGFIVGF